MNGKVEDSSAQYGSTTAGIEASNVHGSVLTCHDISYDVYIKDKACCGQLQPKRILNNIK